MSVAEPTDKQIEAAATAAYLQNRMGTTPWSSLEERHKQAWRLKVQPVVAAALNAR